MKLSPDSFSEKLILNGIDKLVFTLFLMLILAVFTQCQRKHERDQVRDEELISIKIQRPIKMVEELSNLIRQCMLFMQRVSDESLSYLPDEDKEQFSSLLLNLRLNLEMIKSYSRGRPATTCAAGELQRTLESIDFALLKVPVVEDDLLEELRGELYEQFIDLSDSTIDETNASTPIDDSDVEDMDARECPV